MSLDPALRTRLDALVRADHVVLFMKGSPDAPRCGFSARVVELLHGRLGDAFTHVDVLSHPDVRTGMKSYADWPTFPQLWVDGSLVGGADIVEELHDSGQLASTLGSPPAPTSCTIFLTPAARERIRSILEGRTPRLRLLVDVDFQYGFEEVGDPGPHDITVEVGDIVLVVDPGTARRADGMTMDFIEDDAGAGLVVDNPNEPAAVHPLDVETYADWRSGTDREDHVLIDVRTPEERSIAVIEGSRLLDDATEAWLLDQPRERKLVFACHHGVRSQGAAEHFSRAGFTQVYNLEGGIDAWSRWVDPSVRRY